MRDYEQQLTTHRLVDRESVACGGPRCARRERLSALPATSNWSSSTASPTSPARSTKSSALLAERAKQLCISLPAIDTRPRDCRRAPTSSPKPPPRSPTQAASFPNSKFERLARRAARPGPRSITSLDTSSAIRNDPAPSADAHRVARPDRNRRSRRRARRDRPDRPPHQSSDLTRAGRFARLNPSRHPRRLPLARRSRAADPRSVRPIRHPLLARNRTAASRRRPCFKRSPRCCGSTTKTGRSAASFR